MEPRISEIKKWYKEGKPSSFCEPPNFLYLPKFPLAYVKLKTHGAKKVLDVGCYTGYFIGTLHLLGFEVSGVDIQKDLMEEQAKSGLDFRYANAEKLPYKSETFDAVTMFDSLEHCLDDKKAIKEAERVLKKGGLMIINLPRDFENPDDTGEHVRIYTEEYIDKLFKHKYNLEYCVDEHGNKTSFITYTK